MVLVIVVYLCGVALLLRFAVNLNFALRGDLVVGLDDLCWCFIVGS